MRELELKQYLRPEVQSFAVHMENRLRKNDHKGGWKDEDPRWLVTRCFEEWQELRNELALTAAYKPSKVVDEAADVANFAMMISDVAHRGPFRE